ncbi:MAG: hypothetical protein JO023_26195, partial [Chloroflexi bacterium]|nr:hypothetical protein [Chloroflexota bacterium]
MTHQPASVVRRQITVSASQQRAFDFFTARLGTWWPREYSIGTSPMAAFVLEPKCRRGPGQPRQP